MTKKSEVSGETKKSVEIIKAAHGALPEEKTPVEKWKPDTVFHCVRAREDHEYESKDHPSEMPYVLVKGTFLGYGVENWEGGLISPSYNEAHEPYSYAFDDGRMRNGVFLFIRFDERADYVYPHTTEGKKSAEAWMKARHKELLEFVHGARHKDPNYVKGLAEETSNDGINLMWEALGGKPGHLSKVGRARDKKVAELMKQREVYHAKK